MPVLDLAFDQLGLEEAVSFTAAARAPSRRVMAKLGRRSDPSQLFPPGRRSIMLMPTRSKGPS
jgi:RimJ/RimL family protein N-acetyltransferase